jgi:ATP-binding cassette subfamily B protein
MKYTLTNSTNDHEVVLDGGIAGALRKLWPLIEEEKSRLLLTMLFIFINSGLTIWGPILVGNAIDDYLFIGDYDGILRSSLYLFLIYLGVWLSGFFQTRTMGMVGQRVLFRLRNAIFAKLQELPVAFFNQNKAGDLISRINNDTDKLNQFFSRSLMQFIGNAFIVLGAGIAMVAVNSRLGLAALVPALCILIFAQLISGWVKRKNVMNLQTTGGLSSEIAESLQNFRVIVAFNRQDYFRERFQGVNEENYKASIGAGVANNTLVPVFGLASNIGQMIVIVYGLSLISSGDFTFGLLVSYLAYAIRFYDPLRQMASLWTDLQTALAAWDRISEILGKKSDLVVLSGERLATTRNNATMEFRKVGFTYPEGKPVLKHVTFKMEPGKTYALVGPTGGGKTTTASLIARLYDPTEGEIFLSGKDIRSYEPIERAKKIGFILQDPFLFNGTVRDNILYGNDQYQEYDTKQLEELLISEGLSDLMKRFDQGLETVIAGNAEGMSLGQKQLIAFMRAVLRHPDILILDEATANIDTVTEQLLEAILKKLPTTTTRVIIAHRLNTIENADEIFFVNGGTITPAGSLEHAVELLAQGARTS